MRRGRRAERGVPRRAARDASGPSSGVPSYESRSTCRPPARSASHGHFAVRWVSARAATPAPAATSTPVPRGAASSRGVDHEGHQGDPARRAAPAGTPGAATSTSPRSRPRRRLTPSHPPRPRTPAAPRRRSAQVGEEPVDEPRHPPRMPATCEPAATALADCHGGGREPSRRRAARRPGGRDPTGARRGRRVHAAHHRRDELLEHPAAHPAAHQLAERDRAIADAARAAACRARRATRRRPIAAMTSRASGTPGMPSRLVAGSGNAGRRRGTARPGRRWRHDVVAQPERGREAGHSPPRVAKDSAPASSSMPPTVWRAT